MTAGLLPDVLIAGGIAAVAVATLAVRSALQATALFIAFGLLLAIAWVRLGAIDVALTEAAIGAGLSGLLLLGAAARPLPRAGPAPGLALRVAIGGACGLLGLGLMVALAALPDPAPSLAPAVAERLAATELGNPVAAVLMAFRALDTLLEAAVLVFAIIAAWSLTPDCAWGGVPGPAPAPPAHGPLDLLARLLPPIGIVVGIHVVLAGADAPGGKFQGGTILAAMWLLPWMAGLVRPPPIGRLWLRVAIVAGPATFIGIGLLGAVLADAVLAYPEGAAKPLILAIEAAMTVSVAVTLALLVVGLPRVRA